MKLLVRLTLLVLILVAFNNVNAVYVSPKWGYGVEVGGVRGDNAGSDEEWGPRIRGLMQFKIASPLLTQIGVGYTHLKGNDVYKSKALMGDVRLLFRPFPMNQMFPYLYTGLGVTKDMSDDNADYLPVIPAGFGVQTMLGQQLLLQVNGGYNLVLSDELDGIERSDNDLNRFTREKHDGFFELMIGIIYTAPVSEKKAEREVSNSIPAKTGNRDEKKVDTDGDGLNDDIEVNQYKTDPKNPDSDTDGMKDGDEVLKYQTNPLKAYSDADQLKDGEEVFQYRTDPKNEDTDGDGLSDDLEVNQYKTDPNKADMDSDGLNDYEEILKQKTDPYKSDTDGDTLTDGDEVAKYRSDPLKKDTDGDMISDKDEVLQYKTDPVKADSDDDGLNDYAEINTHRTYPLKSDSDLGGMNDGAEIKAGKNPLDANDDLFDLSKGKKIILKGITFEFNKAVILPESKVVLGKVSASMKENPDVTVVISGHTDNVGDEEYNRDLSMQRAQAVKDWLVNDNIIASRMKVIGKGETEPTASNDTDEGRAENRRIEFMVE